MKKFLGALEVYKKTAQSYVAFASFCMLLIGWIKYMDFVWYVTIAVCTGGALLLTGVIWFHVKIIMSREFEYYNKKNPATVKILSDLKDIKEFLKIK